MIQPTGDTGFENTGLGATWATAGYIVYILLFRWRYFQPMGGVVLA